MRNFWRRNRDKIVATFLTFLVILVLYITAVQAIHDKDAVIDSIHHEQEAELANSKAIACILSESPDLRTKAYVRECFIENGARVIKDINYPTPPPIIPK